MEQEVKKRVGAGVGVMIMRDGKVLLGLRNPDRDKADSSLRGEGTWTMPGGKLEYGETFEEAAKREAKEETGLMLTNPRVVCVNNDQNEHAHFVTVGMFANEFGGEPQAMEPDVVEWQWFSLDELPEPIYFPSANVIENYKQQAFYIAR